MLGISPTGDIAAIKQAYAEKSKLSHPEDHPDEFRALHDAYRQAMRYARQHPQTTPVPAAQPKPKRAKPPGFKPSYLPHGAEDNPRRAHLYLCPDDVFTPEQLRTIRAETKHFHASPPIPAPPRALRHELGRLHIRGAAQTRAPSGGLSFDTVLYDDPAPEHTPVVDTSAVTAALVVIPPAKRAQRHLGAPAWLTLALWTLYLLTLGMLLPAPITGLLYFALLAYQFSRGMVRRSWPLTLAAALVDVVSVFSFMVLIETYPAIMVTVFSIVLAITLPLLPLLRIFLRVSVRQT